MENYYLSEEVKEQAAAFDYLGEKYESVFADNKLYINALNWLIDCFDNSKEILDLACGTGKPAAFNLNKAGHKIWGIDVSEEMIRLSKKNIPEGNFSVMDMTKMDFGTQKFDAITAFFALLMLPKENLEQTLDKIKELLKGEKYLVLSMVEAGDFDFVKIPFIDSSIRVSSYLNQEFKDILKEKGFQILKEDKLDFVPEEGGNPETQIFYLCQLK